MEKIRLTKAEKAVLREIANTPITTPEHKDEAYICALHDLEQKGFVDCSMLKQAVMRAGLTTYGFAYLHSNPKLRNPLPWDKIFGGASIIAAIAAVAALFVGCIRLMAATLH